MVRIVVFAVLLAAARLAAAADLPLVPFDDPPKPSYQGDRPAKEPAKPEPAAKPDTKPDTKPAAKPEDVRPADDAPAAGAKLTTRQQREVNRSLAHFRKAKKEPAKQVEAIVEAMRFGPPAVAALMQAIGQDLHPQLARYRNKFYQQAALVAKRQLGKVNVEEIAQLRAAVVGLSSDPNLTKEKIVAVGDPAMKRLEEVFVVRPVEVLASSKDLQAERLKLQVLGALWEQCAVYLFRMTPAEADKPKDPPTFERYLLGEEELAVGLAVPMDDATREVLAANAKLSAQLDPEESRTILALNLMRNVLGLAPVAIDLKLCAAARDHSTDMETLKFFAHDSPVPGKKTPWDRAARFGTSASAENIFAGLHDGRAANLGWFHSPGHHKNMLGKHKRVGVGRAGAYFTEMFGE